MARVTKTIPDEVAAALKKCEYKEEGIFLGAPGSMDPKLYKQVTRVLEGIGIKWDRRKGIHAPNDPHKSAKGIIEAILEDGEFVDERVKYREDFQFFPTIPEVAEKMAKALLRGEGDTIDRTLLEPSAGRGALIREVLDYGFCGAITAIELQPEFASDLGKMAHTVLTCDFLDYSGNPGFDYVIANPPFSKKRDFLHIERALGFLKPGGKMVCLVSQNCPTNWGGAQIDVIEHFVIAGSETKAASKMLRIIKDC